MKLGQLSERAKPPVRGAGGVRIGSASVVLLLGVACGRLPLGVRQLPGDAGPADSPLGPGGLDSPGDTPDAGDSLGSRVDGGPASADVLAPSCRAEPRCGSDGLSCCAARTVPGGTFDLGLRASETIASRTTVATFSLDVFEVTVGRFREFVADYDRWRASDSAAQLAGSDALPSDSAALQQALLRCDTSPYSSWAGTGEEVPMNCASWFEASAFCAWDGGRLPLEAEWEYAAVGGAEQRLYPWGNTPEPQPELALFGCDLEADCTRDALSRVGSHAAGAGRWGQQDLAGSLAEWLDAAGASPFSAHPFVGGSWIDDPSALRIADHSALPPEIRLFVLGFRCAR
ncbi:MAG: hypothetical protein RL685_2981 [Pseudomonadota bacterium]